MAWSDESSVEPLKRAFKENRFPDADALIDELITSFDRQPRRVDAGIAKKILALLRSHARFEQQRREIRCAKSELAAGPLG